MITNAALLKIVTNETKKSINQLEIVTPSVFSAIFFEHANAHNLTLDDEVKTALEIMRTECSMLSDLQTRTSENAIQLSDSTSKAILAIKEQDEAILNEVLKETQLLRDELEKLKESIYKDTLTNSYNRKWVHDNYVKHQSNVSKNTGVFALIDLNYFKIINDTYGHVIGDKVLAFIANEFLKTSYPVVRYGGDEFIIMFPAELSQEEVFKILTNLREDILKKKFKASNKTFTVSFSFGIQKFSSGDACTDILEAADKNMYKDKQIFKKRITGI